MPVPPPTLSTDQFEQARRFVVLAKDGELPTAADEVNYLIPLSVSRAIGTSGRLESISLKWALERSNHRLVDAKTPVGYNQFVSICYLDDNDDLHQLAWGRIPEQKHQIGARAESVQVTARIDDDLIGSERITGHYQWQPSGSPVFVDQPILLNPRVDGTIRGNCSGVMSTTPDVFWWVDPEATAATHSTVPQRWTLARAIHALCWLCNSSERYVNNPSITYLQSVFDDPFGTNNEEDKYKLVRNISIGMGTSLREAMNALLRPLHYGWRLDHNDIPGEKSDLRFFSLRDGIGVDLSIARPGEVITRANTNLDNYSATISVVDLANVVRGFSSPIDYEDTWQLAPAWHPSKDSDSNYSPERIQAAGNHELLATTDVWMKFALNENKDYDAYSRASMATSDITADKLRDQTGSRSSSVRRRRFRPCLAQSLEEKDGHSVGDRGYFLELCDVTDTSKWDPVNWHFEVLTDECAIRLRKPDARIKHFMAEHPALPPLRLTATVRSDFNAWGIADQREESPQGSKIESILDLSGKFHVRRMNATSRHYDNRHFNITAVSTNSITVDSELDEIIKAGERVVIIDSTGNDGGYTISGRTNSGGSTTITTVEPLPDSTGDGTLAVRTEEACDGRLLQTHCERARDKDDVAQISLSCSVDRFEPAFKIGETVRTINGRNLDLNASTSTTDPVYLTIVGLNYSLSGEQHTEIMTETFRGENYNDGES